VSGTFSFVFGILIIRVGLEHWPDTHEFITRFTE